MIGVEASIYRSGWGPLKQSQIQGFSNLLKCCCSSWRKDEDQKRRKAAEEDNLYIFKARTGHVPSYELDDAQELETEVFPLYKIIDGEYTTDEHQDDQSSLYTEALSVNDLYHICRLHLSLFNNESRESELEHQPPLEAYHVASYLVHSLRTLPGNNIMVYCVLMECIHPCSCIGRNADYLLAGANIRMCHHHLKSLHTSIPIHSRLVLESSLSIHPWTVT